MAPPSRLIVPIRGDDVPSSASKHSTLSMEDMESDEQLNEELRLEWRLANPGPYLQHVKEESYKQPRLSLLADWMEVSTAPSSWTFLKSHPEVRNERAQRVRVAIIDYGTDDLATCEEHFSAATLQDSLKATAVQGQSGIRLLICEDLSRDVVETLGSFYHIDPAFFLAHIDGSLLQPTQQRWSELVNSLSDTSAFHFKLQYPRAHFFTMEEDYARAKREVKQFNVARSLVGGKERQPTEGLKPGSSVAVHLATTSLWIRKSGDATAITGILILDPTLDAGTELRADYKPFNSSPLRTWPAAIGIRKEGPKQNSLFREVVDICSRFGPQDLRRIRNDPRCIAMPVYGRVTADWLQVLNYFTAVLSTIEWQFEKQSWGEQPNNLNETFTQLLLWRRNASDNLSMINDNIANLFPATTSMPFQEQSAIFELWSESRFLRQKANQIQARISSIEAVTLSNLSVEETINKMYGYYDRAEVCLVFLPDVDPVSLGSDAIEVTAMEGIRQMDGFTPFLEEQFVHSRWFHRGWTLQELLAPEKLLFFNSRYKPLGGSILCDSSESAQMARFIIIRGVLHSIRNGPIISDLITKATGISEDVLTYGVRLAKPCIARRMSWAAHRTTTRDGDLAYCLLGLFEVNMPLLYSEGAVKAFTRLQMKILSTSTDESIFAWKLADHLQAWSGLLAPSPKGFSGCQNMSEIPYYTAAETRELNSSYLKTKEGIELVLCLPRGLMPLGDRRWIHPLRCGFLDKDRIRRCSLQVRTRSKQAGRPADHALTAQRWRASIFFLDGANEYHALKQALGWGRPHLLVESFDSATSSKDGLIGHLSSTLSAFEVLLQGAHITWREWMPTMCAASNAIRLVFPYHTLRSEPYLGAFIPEDRGMVNSMTLVRYTVQSQTNITNRDQASDTTFVTGTQGSARRRRPFGTYN
ncbi:hypothetical protein BST61_g2994 [Cercospora zeina]